MEVEDEAEKKAAEAKMQRLLADPILKPLLEDLCHWLARILQIDITPENFTIPLQTGDDLCKLAIAISLKAQEQGMHCPKIRYKSGAKPGSFQARCNIEAFVKWAKDLGVKETCLFETVDIVELKYLRNVLICLLEISRLADRYGVEPPELVKLEKSTKIRWQDLIKLSMKRKSASGGDQVLSLAAISSTIGEIQKEVNKADQEGITLERSSSVIKKWKAFTRSSLRSRGEAISPDPNKILDDTPPQFGTPPSQFGTPESQSMLSDIVGTPIQSMMDIVEDAIKMEKSEVEETPLTIDIEAETQEPEIEEEPVTIDIELEQSDSPNLNIEIEDLQQEDTAVLEIGLSTTDPDTEVGFEDVTEEPESEKDEVHLTLELEDVVMPDDLEEFTVEEMLDDESTDQEFSMAVEAELVEVVHSQPELEAQELDLDREATPTLETEAEVAIDVALDLETVLDQDLELAVEQEFVEAVQTQPDLELESSGDEEEAAPIVKSEPVIEADVILDSESSGDEQEITVEVKSEPVVEEVVLEDEELEITVEQDIVEVVELQPDIDQEAPPDVAGVDIVVEVPETADQAEAESAMSEDEAVETQKISWKPQGDSEEEGEVTVVYETEDRPLPSAPVMEILVHTEDQREVPVDVPDEQAGHTNLAFEGDISGEMSSSFEVSASVSVEEPPVAVEAEDKVDVTWWFALCFPAVVEGNKDGSCLSEEQVEELDYKRSVYLLVGIILTVIGTALAITDGVLGTGTEGKLSNAGFFVILALSLICLIAGLSLISLWVVQHLKMRNKKLTALGKSTDYGTIR